MNRFVDDQGESPVQWIFGQRVSTGKDKKWFWNLGNKTTRFWKQNWTYSWRYEDKKVKQYQSQGLKLLKKSRSPLRAVGLIIQETIPMVAAAVRMRWGTMTRIFVVWWRIALHCQTDTLTLHILDHRRFVIWYKESCPIDQHKPGNTYWIKMDGFGADRNTAGKWINLQALSLKKCCAYRIYHHEKIANSIWSSDVRLILSIFAEITWNCFYTFRSCFRWVLIQTDKKLRCGLISWILVHNLWWITLTWGKV